MCCSWVWLFIGCLEELCCVGFGAWAGVQLDGQCLLKQPNLWCVHRDTSRLAAARPCNAHASQKQRAHLHHALSKSPSTRVHARLSPRALFGTPLLRSVAATHNFEQVFRKGASTRTQLSYLVACCQSQLPRCLFLVLRCGEGSRRRAAAENVSLACFNALAMYPAGLCTTPRRGIRADA